MAWARHSVIPHAVGSIPDCPNGSPFSHGWSQFLPQRTKRNAIVIRALFHAQDLGKARRIEWRLHMSAGTILLIILILILIGALPTWPYSSGWGYYPSGGLGLVVVILLILVLMGRL